MGGKLLWRLLSFGLAVRLESVLGHCPCLQKAPTMEKAGKEAKDKANGLLETLPEGQFGQSPLPLCCCT